jgi:hypothetical protein
VSNTTTTCCLRQKGPLTQSHTFFTHISRAVSKKSFNSTKSQTVREKIHDFAMPCILTTIYVLTFQKPSTMYRPSHPSIEPNPRISTTEHVHALYFLSHIGCTVTINRVKKSLKRCHSIGWKRSCDNQKFNRKENFTKVRELFRRQQFWIYWPDNSHLSIIIKYAKVIILSVV